MNVLFAQLSVRDVMRPNPVLVDENTPLEKLFSLFSAHHIPCVIVIDDDGRLQGSISMGDLEKSRQLYDLREYIQIIMDGLDPATKEMIADSFFDEGPIDLKAREIMSIRFPRVQLDESVAVLSHQLIQGNAQYAVVVDRNEKVIGTVSTFDILKAIDMKPSR